MSAETARKAVVFTLLIGSAVIVWSGVHGNQPTATTYRRVWGLFLLVIGGAMLADFAPRIVGPYLILATLGLVLHDRGQLGSLVKSGSNAVQTGG